VAESASDAGAGKTDGFTWATRVIVPLVIAGLGFYGHEKLTAANQLSVLYTVMKDLEAEDPSEGLIYLNLAQKLGQIDEQSADQLKSLLVSKTAAKADQDFASDDPNAESSGMQALDLIQATSASAAQEFTRRPFLVVVAINKPRDEAEKLRQELLAKGFPGAELYSTPKQFAVSLGDFPFQQALAAKKKFEALPPINPDRDNIGHLRRAPTGWTQASEESPAVGNGEAPGASGASSSAAPELRPTGVGPRLPHRPIR
jgi:hypothetical protein